ncbi:MAG: phosphoribosylformylglycinamidine cyclo-ligase [Polyangiaceae bacterium]|nr:phosphoribosylformylglycinamidine cyclo-ligase [Polyangiaceae bacterium]
MAITYAQAGVDIDRGDELVERIKPLARRTRTPLVVSDVGGFAGLCRVPPGMSDPVLVSGTDGVGTKLKIAFATGQHGTIGEDLVAMCVNDIVTCGAAPLFFLDYFATGRLSLEVAEAVIAGIARGCELAGCALLGGETAELPGMYADGEYDLAGFAVGAVDRPALIDGRRVQAGDAVIGCASTGLHSNGYSLARRVLQTELGLALDAHVPELGQTAGEALLTPTRIYAKAVAALLDGHDGRVHAQSHITGGGLPGNVPRVLPEGTGVALREGSWDPAPIFSLIERGGPVERREMWRAFNMGLGLVVVVDPAFADEAVRRLSAAGERATIVGEVEARGADVQFEDRVRFV